MLKIRKIMTYVSSNKFYMNTQLVTNYMTMNSKRAVIKTIHSKHLRIYVSHTLFSFDGLHLNLALGTQMWSLHRTSPVWPLPHHGESDQSERYWVGCWKDGYGSSA